MLDQCQANLERWRQIDEETKNEDDKSRGVDALTFLDKVLETSEKSAEEKEVTVADTKSVDVPEERDESACETLKAGKENSGGITEVIEEKYNISEEGEVENRKQDEVTTPKETEILQEKKPEFLPAGSCGIKEDEIEVLDLENKEDEDVDVSLIIQQLTDEDTDIELHGTIRVAEAKVTKHKAGPLET